MPPTSKRLSAALLELEYTLIPHGLHVVGEGLNEDQRLSMLDAAGVTDALERKRLDGLLAVDHEIPAIIHALDGGYIRPAPGGDLLRTTDVLPTGRNLHGFDPFRIPSAFAVRDGARQADRLLARHKADSGELPETVAMVLWGTDNLKTEGGPIAQALWLLGAEPRSDSYGRVSGATLIPLEALGRPRIDVVVTLSGIFAICFRCRQNFLPRLRCWRQLPMNQLNKILFASTLCHSRQNMVVLSRMRRCGCSATPTVPMAQRQHLVGSGTWNDEGELADAYLKRKGFAYGVSGRPDGTTRFWRTHWRGSISPTRTSNSLEMGVTTVDHYFDTLGGISRAVRRARGGERRRSISGTRHAATARSVRFLNRSRWKPAPAH